MSDKKIDAGKLDIAWNPGTSAPNEAEVVSIAGNNRIVAHSPEKIPLAYFNEINELGLTQWFDSCTSLSEARFKALRGGTFEGFIVVSITSNNNLIFFPAR